jgi:hypothetical protein
MSSAACTYQAQVATRRLRVAPLPKRSLERAADELFCIIDLGLKWSWRELSDSAWTMLWASEWTKYYSPFG